MTEHVEIRKNAHEVIRVERQDFKGHDVINARTVGVLLMTERCKIRQRQRRERQLSL